MAWHCIFSDFCFVPYRAGLSLLIVKRGQRSESQEHARFCAFWFKKKKALHNRAKDEREARCRSLPFRKNKRLSKIALALAGCVQASNTWYPVPGTCVIGLSAAAVLLSANPYIIACAACRPHRFPQARCLQKRASLRKLVGLIPSYTRRHDFAAVDTLQQCVLQAPVPRASWVFFFSFYGGKKKQTGPVTR